MSIERLFTRSLRSVFVNQLRRHATAPKETFDLKEAKTVAEFPEEVVELPPERLIKGGLNNEHRRILMGQKPYDEGLERFHNSVKYKKKLLGRYGMEAAGVPAGIAWPTVEEVALMKEYERVAYPVTLQEQWDRIEIRDKEIKDQIARREAELEANMAQSEKWKQQLFAKIQKKKDELAEAQKKKDKMMEEIRRHFGYMMSTKDERFQKLLQEKEEQDKKKRKEDRKRLKEEQKAESLRRMEEVSRASLKKIHKEQMLSKKKNEKVTGETEKISDDGKNN